MDNFVISKTSPEREIKIYRPLNGEEALKLLIGDIEEAIRSLGFFRQHLTLPKLGYKVVVELTAKTGAGGARLEVRGSGEAGEVAEAEGEEVTAEVTFQRTETAPDLMRAEAGIEVLTVQKGPEGRLGEYPTKNPPRVERREDRQAGGGGNNPSNSPNPSNPSPRPNQPNKYQGRK